MMSDPTTQMLWKSLELDVDITEATHIQALNLLTKY